MPHPLRDIQSIDSEPAAYLRDTCQVFAAWDDHTQDSGNISYGVSHAGESYFVKTAGHWLLPSLTDRAPSL